MLVCLELGHATSWKSKKVFFATVPAPLVDLRAFQAKAISKLRNFFGLPICIILVLLFEYEDLWGLQVAPSQSLLIIFWLRLGWHSLKRFRLTIVTIYLVCRISDASCLGNNLLLLHLLLFQRLLLRLLNGALLRLLRGALLLLLLLLRRFLLNYDVKWRFRQNRCAKVATFAVNLLAQICRFLQ